MFKNETMCMYIWLIYMRKSNPHKIATSIVSSEEFGNAVEIEKEVKAETRKETIVLYNNPLSKNKKGEKRRRIYASVK